MFLLLIMFCIFVQQIQCFTPNCVPENQFRNYDFPVEACSEYFTERCRFHPKGYFKSLGYVSLVKIRETTVVPTCAFFSAEQLRYIYGVKSKIKVLATRAFVNLPNLKAIHLQFNYITEVRQDTFKNISTELLDLSWNKIAFIDAHAFKQVINLKFLNLSRNSLSTLSVNSLTKTLQSLNLAHNWLERLALNSESFSNLTFVNVSDNRINKVAISFNYPAETFDLTNNHIQDFDYISISSVKKFKMGKNLFEVAPKYLEYINAEEVDIYPNPWKCNELKSLWDTLVSFNIRLATMEQGKNPPFECANVRSRFVTATRSTDCFDDHECPSYMACRANKCWDPCDESLCHTSNFCETKNHVFNCSCSYGGLIDPLDVYAECKKDVECFADSNCAGLSTCWNHKCSRLDDLYPINTNETDLTTPLFNRFEDNEDNIPIWGIFGDQDSSTRRPLPPVTSTVSTPTELPWWYEEIPSLVPEKSSPKKLKSNV